MSIHDGTSPDETLPDTPAESAPTDAEKLLAEVVEVLEAARLLTQRAMNAYARYSDMWKYWAARHEESKTIHDLFAGQTVKSLLAMYEYDKMIQERDN